ncbi:MAG: hypothetical protein KDB36_00970, partial [Acidimicrobiales bacterium]|nr:hypothetical protein [Acidimicrobiales bacterium]
MERKRALSLAAAVSGTLVVASVVGAVNIGLLASASEPTSTEPIVSLGDVSADTTSSTVASTTTAPEV